MNHKGPRDSLATRLLEYMLEDGGCYTVGFLAGELRGVDHDRVVIALGGLVSRGLAIRQERGARRFAANRSLYEISPAGINWMQQKETA